MKPVHEKHLAPMPTLRKLRRACNNELYRTIKRMKIWVPPEKLAEAEALYLRKVVFNLQFIVDNSRNRKLLSDWWDENVCPEIAELWSVDPKLLASSFREAFGG